MPTHRQRQFGDGGIGTPSDLITQLDPKSPVAEAYRTLRTNIQFAGADGKLKSVLITSATPEEGKTTIATNLAVVMAYSGMKICIVGADLRKPTVYKRFNLSNAVGLTSALVGQAHLDDVVFPTEIENLSAVPAGPIPPNPAELLGSKRMREIIAALEERFDMVIIDSPPAISVTDAHVLAQMLDGVLLVVALKMAPRQIVQQAREQLDKVGARILGVVVNRVESAGNYGYYYYYYYRSDEKSEGQEQAAATREKQGLLARVLAFLKP